MFMNDPILSQPVRIQLSLIDQEVVKVLLYFDLFEHPLKSIEVFKNLSVKTTQVVCDESLRSLCNEGLIESKMGYFYIVGKGENVQRRIEGASMASKFMPKAIRISKFISKVAFVKGIFISGSLSKGFMQKGSDIDYFIITDPNRVWFVKGWLALIKKVFLLNSKKYFCLNYFIDSDHLHIKDHNEFTAKEINYLIPTYSQKYYSLFLEANSWSFDLLPNFNVIHKNVELIEGSTKWKKIKERIWSGQLGNWFDTMSMRLFEKYWKKKYKKKFKVNEGIQIKCQKHVSKIHPGNYQDKVLTNLKAKKEAFENRYKVSLEQ